MPLGQILHNNRTMTPSFTIIQQRQSLGIQCADLCRTMDLIAIVSDDGMLSVYRTISWERIFCKKVAELRDSSKTVVINRISFSIVGKYLAIGFLSGDIAILNIETVEVREALIPASALNILCEISALQWQLFSSTPLYPHISSWKFGGVNQRQRGGMPDGLPLIEGKRAATNWYDEICEQLSESLLLSLRVNLVLCGHVFGLYPLFTIDCSAQTLVPVVSSSVIGCSKLSSDSFNSLIYSHITLKSIDGVVRGAMQSTLCLPVTNLLHSDYKWTSHCSSLQVGIEQNLATLKDIASSSLRKWKDATKVLLPKLQLLQSLMDTYELQMTPIQFLYSISMCGLWHPAAATSFAQHWAEAGIERLRASVESVSKEIVTSLQLRAVPIVNNLLLAARELLELYDSYASHLVDNESTLLRLRRFVRSCEHLAFKLDETLFEARLAGEAMLLYIQFVRDCSLEAAITPDAVANNIKPDLSLRPKYHLLLNPSVVRADAKGSQGQAEYLTGTHLYAYLQEATLPPELVKDRQKTCGFGSPLQKNKVNNDKSECKISQLVEVLEMGDDLSLIELFGDSGTTERKLEGKAPASRSFAQQIKCTLEAFKSISSIAHSQLSHQLSVDLISALDSTVGKHAVRVDDTLQVIASTTSVVSHMNISLQSTDEDADERQTLKLDSCLCSAYIIHNDQTEPDSQLLLVCSHLNADNLSTLYCCRIDLSTWFSNIIDVNNSSIQFGSSMCLYSRTAEGDCCCVSVLLTFAVDCEDSDKCGTYLLKINVSDDLTFTTLTGEPLILISTMSSLQSHNSSYDSSVFQYRRISAVIQTTAKLWESEERGILLVSLQGGKQLVIDLEADEDTSDSDNSCNED